ncbi:cupin domain-containing protein [Streptomyces sp. NPDC059349]|uniref:cupin domain-containing protein n=1 Tax=Streptomyces sp. NPDC059349 TaxID=3346808 RepID=UPI00367C078E
MPPHIPVRGSSEAAHVLRPALQLLVCETAASRPGSALMTVHLARIIFVQALRTLSATGESAADQN